MNPAVILLFSLPIAIIGIFLIRKARRREKYKTIFEKWQEIEDLITKPSEIYWKMAVIEADKIVDYALKQKETPGKDMGERIRFAKSKNHNLGKLWGPHILRNNLVHETNHTITQKEAKWAIRVFKEGLKIMGVL